MKFMYVRPIAVFALFAALLNFIFFFGLGAQQIIFSGDQFFRFNAYEAFTNSFFLRKPSDLGVLNGWQFTTQFWDALYYQVVYYFGLTPKLAEVFLFFLVLFLSMFLSYLGFKRGAKYFGITAHSSSVYLVVVWYCFNPYTLELWHGGVYNLGSCLTYSLAPLIFFQFSEAIFSATDKRRIFISALVISIASYTFWLMAPLVFFLTLYFIFRIALQFHLRRTALKNISCFLLFYIPLISFILFGILHEYFNNSGDNNATFQPTFGNMQGGIWYQLLMLYSWGIYTVWNPRSIYPFGDYFFSPPYIAGIVLLYLMILFGLLIYFTKSKQMIGLSYFDRFFGHIHTHVARRWTFGTTRSTVLESTAKCPSIKYKIITLSAILMCSLFLAKGAQPPLGAIFSWLYNNVPFFNVFRTPDIRFGFVITLALALLLLFVSKYFQKNIFIIGVITFTVLQAWHIFTGVAVKGSNVGNLYYDRIIQIPDNQKSLASFVNLNTTTDTYVLTIPSVSYGHYIFENNDHLIGQDLLPKIIKAPFLYVSSSDGMSSRTYKLLDEIIVNEQYERLKDFPIRYVLLRNDICPDCKKASITKLAEVADLVFKNSTFDLYQMRSYRPIVDSPNVYYERVSPIKYRVTFTQVSKLQDLVFLQSFNRNWKLFLENKPANSCGNSKETIACDSNELTLLQFEDWKYLWKSPLFESSHQPDLDYANGWAISPDLIKSQGSSADYTVNSDGSLNFTLTIYFLPQIWYFLFGVIALMTAVILTSVLLLGSSNKYPGKAGNK